MAKRVYILGSDECRDIVACLYFLHNYQGRFDFVKLHHVVLFFHFASLMQLVLRNANMEGKFGMRPRLTHFSVLP